MFGGGGGNFGGVAGVSNHTKKSGKLIVYLDSSDFIAFSAYQLSPKLRQTFYDLIDLKNKGIAEFGVSLFHITEVLNPDSPNHKDYQKHCGEIIYHLCEHNAFPYISDIPLGDKFPNSGLWIPRVGMKNLKNILEPKEIRKLALEYLRENTDLIRKERRLATTPESLASTLLESSAPAPRALEALGISTPDFVQMVRSPHRSRKKFGEKILNYLSDPRYYCEAISSVAPGENPLRALLDDLTKRSQLGLLKMFEASNKMKTLENEMSENIGFMREIFGDSPLVQDLRSDLRSFRKKQRESIDNFSIEFDDGRFLYLKSYFKNIQRVEKPPTPSESIDLLHLAYHREVDLIRADSRMAEIMKADKQLSSKIVAKISDLPDAIVKLYRKRTEELSQR